MNTTLRGPASPSQIQKSIECASWLTETTRDNLLALHDSMTVKDILNHSFDFLEIDGCTNTPLECKNLSVSILRLLTLKGAKKILGTQIKEAGYFMYRLYLFFDVLDNTDFDKSIDIQSIIDNDDLSDEDLEKKSFELLKSYSVG